MGFAVTICSEVRVSRRSFVASSLPIFEEDEDSDEFTEDQKHDLLIWKTDYGKRRFQLVFHPQSSFLNTWSAMNRILAVYFFLDVPFRMAFHSFRCFGSW